MDGGWDHPSDRVPASGLRGFLADKTLAKEGNAIYLCFLT